MSSRAPASVATAAAARARDPAQHRVLGHPKGVFLVALTEFWERFSYYGMLGLLVLFLTAPAARDGLGWSTDDALLVYGVYSGLAFATPVLGAWIANNYLGERRCIVLGGLLVSAGHLVLALLGLLPTGSQATSIVLFAGLGLIIAGTALIKPTVSSIVGRFYAPDDPDRERAFSMFFVFIYLGAVTANLVAGTLGERLGWHYGFGAAAVGMWLGLTVYLLKQNEYLGDIGVRPPLAEAKDRGVPTRLTPEEYARLRVLALQALFTICYAIGFYQKGGLLNLFARERIDRTVAGFEIPATWLLSISTAVFIVAAPAAAAFWHRRAQHGGDVGAAGKLALGLACLGGGHWLMSLAAADASVTGAAALGWIVATYVLFGIGDACVWPNQIALASRLAPARYSSLLIGGWYVSIGIGTYLSGHVGALASRYTAESVFTALAIALFAAAALLLALRGTMRGWARDAAV